MSKMLACNFDYLGEVRFGPTYYSLSIDGKKVDCVAFGEEHLLFMGKRYLATQEWLTVDYENGPITQVTFFDLKENLKSSIDIVNKGFVKNFRFEAGVFYFEKDFPATGQFVQSQIQFSEVASWEPICFS